MAAGVSIRCGEGKGARRQGQKGPGQGPAKKEVCTWGDAFRTTLEPSRKRAAEITAPRLEKNLAMTNSPFKLSRIDQCPEERHDLFIVGDIGKPFLVEVHIEGYMVNACGISRFFLRFVPQGLDCFLRGHGLHDDPISLTPVIIKHIFFLPLAVFKKQQPEGISIITDDIFPLSFILSLPIISIDTALSLVISCVQDNEGRVYGKKY